MKKRVLSLVLSILMVLSMFAWVNINSFAATVDDLDYYVNSSYGFVSINGCNTSASGELIIPETIEGYPVTNIGDRAFVSAKIEKLTIPASVTSIGVLAFGSSVAYISVSAENEYYSSDENGVLFNKDKTKLLCYPEGRSSIEYIIPDGVSSIADYAFAGCSNLKSIVFPDTVTSIGAFGLSGVGFEEIIIPDSVTSLGADVFDSCKNLKKVVFGKNMKSTIDKTTFAYCSSLSSISVSAENEYYCSDENGVLFNKDKTKIICCPVTYDKTEYIIPESVTQINRLAFAGCSNLKSIKIPDSVTSIGSCAFTDASNLSDITIPDSVEFIDGGYTYKSFSDNLLSGTAYYEDEANWENGILYCGNHVVASVTLDEFSLREGTIGIAGNAFHHLAGVENITIPESVKYIGDWAFAESINWIKSVTILGDVTSIGECVFYDCWKLTSVTLPDSVTFIGNSAFSDCESLVSIDLPESLQTIDHYAFEGCRNLTTIYIPAGVESIGSYAFENCDKMQDVYYAGTENEWNLIEKGYIKLISSATIHYNDVCSHAFTEAKDAVDATCTQNGSTGEVSCMACGEVISSGETVPATGHIFGDWVVDKEATCTENGSKSYRCEKCDDVADVTEIPATGHNFGEWTITAEATYVNKGEMTRECSACSEKETQSIEKLEASAESVDANTNIIAKYQDSTYNGEMKIEVVQELDGEAFRILNNEKGDFENMLFDITTTVDGENVQPNGYVLVGIPLPEGYNPEETVVYFVANDGSGLVKMNSFCADGYIWFETNHFSSYAIVNETAPEYTPGDVNGDTKITAADARIVLRASAKIETLDDKEFLIADVNKDNKITAADARKILRVSAKIETF